MGVQKLKMNASTGYGCFVVLWRPFKTADYGYVVLYGCRPMSASAGLGCGLLNAGPVCDAQLRPLRWRFYVLNLDLYGLCGRGALWSANENKLDNDCSSRTRLCVVTG